MTLTPLEPDCLARLGVSARAIETHNQKHAAKTAGPEGKTMPKRIQMTRRRPWRAENPDAVIVARPSKWGNPFAARIPHGESLQPRETRQHLVEQFRTWLLDGVRFDEVVERMPLVDEQGRVWRTTALHTTRPTPREARVELAGRDLACWCPLDQPCHADVLLELANPEEVPHAV